jgi:DNA-binding SARP family transcriptional activator/tetratricopeptide (TPR) repeat protein
MDVGDVRRSALLERLERARPVLVALVAPAGFGKSTLVKQMLAQRPGRVCDCSDLRDDLDLARRLLPELAAELGDGGSSVAERVEAALVAWGSVSGVVAFENAHHLNATSAARGFFKRLLAARPPLATIVVSARDGARLALNRYAAPHEIVAIRAAELALSFDEVAAVFGAHPSDESAIRRIAAVTRGWPVAVSLLRRTASERGLPTLLEQLDVIASEELRDYLIDEVLIGLDARVVQGIFACASIPAATAADIRIAFGDPTLVDDLAEFAKDSPFVARAPDGTFRVAPLLAALVVEHQTERRSTLLRDVAAAREEAGDYERAAELHAARGDQHAAARVLAKHEALADRHLSETYMRTLAGIDRAIVLRHPRLWGISALIRLFCVDTERLVDEAESVWRTLAPDATPMERFYVVLFRAVFSSYVGSYDDAFEMIDAFAEASALAQPPRLLLDGYVVYLRALLRARTGAYAQAERELNLALSVIGEIDVAASSIYLCFGADIARVRGERAIEVQFLERAVERARASGLDNLLALDQVESVFGAWFVGDMVAFRNAVDALDQTCRRSGVVAFKAFLAAARGQRGEPSSSDVARSIVYARLLSLGTMRDSSERLRIAESAFSLALRVGSPFLEVLAAVALATCDDLRFGDCLAVARDAAARCESPALLAAVKAVAERRSDVGMLSAFITNVERGRTDAPAPIAVDVTVGRVRVDGALVALSGRELELVVALAVRRDATPRSRLAAMLWPDLEIDAARNALSVCLHRLRGHLRRSDAIVRENDGYRLHADAIVDVWEIERAAVRLRSREPLLETDRVALERTWARLREERPERMHSWEWFEPTLRRLDAMRVDVSHRLGAEALERGDTAGALQFSYDAIALDGCDEPAYEVAIRAHIRDGDRAAALRAYRTYRDTLRAELSSEPSALLASLVAG